MSRIKGDKVSKMKKTTALVIALTLLTATILGACGGGVGNANTTAATQAAGATQAQTTAQAAETTQTQTAAPVEQTTEAVTPNDSDSAQKIIWAVHNEADTLDPGISNNTFASPILINVFEGLMTYNPSGDLIPGVAESYTIDESGTSYTFVLRDGLKWSDGSDLTAEDFIYAWTRVITPETASNFSTMITDYVKNSKEFFDGEAKIEDVGFKALDAKTIQIDTYAPTPYFLDILSTYTWSPVKRSVVEANPEAWARDASNYICNGPFKPVDLTIGKGYVLAKNDYYYDAAKVKLREINMRLIPDNSTALTAFESGEIDGIYDVPVDDIPRLKAESSEYYSIPQFGDTYFLINTGKAPLDDWRVRKALALALDRNSLIQNVLQTSDLPATGLVAPGYVVNGKDYTDGRPDYDVTPTANIEMARNLLSDAGYPNGAGFPRLNLSYYTNANVKKYTEAMQQMWKENLNIDMDISTEEWKVYYDNVQAFNYDVCAMGWGGDYLNPITFLECFISDSVNNNTQWKNSDYDKYIREAMGTVDPVKGMELMRSGEDILMGEGGFPLIPLYYRSRNIMMKYNVRGWYLTALNNMYFKYCEKVIAN